MMTSYRLESTFFSTSKLLELYITDVEWLDKSRQKIRLDLVHQTSEELPEGVRFEKAERKENGWLLTFSGEEYQKKVIIIAYGQVNIMMSKVMCMRITVGLIRMVIQMKSVRNI